MRASNQIGGLPINYEVEKTVERAAPPRTPLQRAFQRATALLLPRSYRRKPRRADLESALAEAPTSTRASASFRHGEPDAPRSCQQEDARLFALRALSLYI